MGDTLIRRHASSEQANHKQSHERHASRLLLVARLGQVGPGLPTPKPGTEHQRGAANEAGARAGLCALMRPEVEAQIGSLAEEGHANNASYPLDENFRRRAGRLEGQKKSRSIFLREQKTRVDETHATSSIT